MTRRARCAGRLALAVAIWALIGACAAPPTGAPPPAALPPTAAPTTPARTHLTLGVGGQELFVYLPLTLAQRLSYFDEAGVDVEIVNFQGGGKALEALVGGGLDAVVGFF